MNAGFTAKSIMLLFVSVLILYFVVFEGIEYLRYRKGPWVIDFQGGANGSPTLLISQPHLRLTNVLLVLRGERMTNGSGRVSFDRVQRPVPFGRMIYEDLTFLPGVLTFDLYGHEVELLPRTLVINRRQIPWRSGATVDLWPTNKPPHPPQPPDQRPR
ncbi:MAG TPA: hypothetical protein VNM37_16655 [Candidatus Dormibacteraeota bacterium]|nr:hypothetical protein [Candidatus Dormibacteraeota bacterium]